MEVFHLGQDAWSPKNNQALLQSGGASGVCTPAPWGPSAPAHIFLLSPSLRRMLGIWGSGLTQRRGL